MDKLNYIDRMLMGRYKHAIRIQFIFNIITTYNVCKVKYYKFIHYNGIKNLRHLSEQLGSEASY